MKKIFLLGSSGSIGQSTLDVVRQFPDKFSIEALTVNSSVSVLQSQIREFQPKVIAVGEEVRAAMISADGRFFYTADYDGFNDGGGLKYYMLQYSISNTGLLIPLNPFKVETDEAPMPIFVIPDSRIAYVANQGSNTVWLYDVGLGGQMTFIESIQTGNLGASPAAFAYVKQ